MKINCPSCEIQYNVISPEAKDEGVEPQYCPFCGFETAEELDFDEPKYDDVIDEDEDDWDDWHPNESFN